MVSIRCKLILKEILTTIGIPYTSVDLGVVELPHVLTKGKKAKLQKALLLSGLELMEDKRTILVERIKNEIVAMVHYADERPHQTNSDYLAGKLLHDYTYLANIFSATTGFSIAHFIIHHRIEKVKELLQYNELNLTEISYKLHYSSVAHLSNQFKKITGFTPTGYKKMKQLRLKNLEDL